MKKLVYALIISIALVSCQTPTKVRKLVYDLDCPTCGNTKDGLLQIDINRAKIIDPDEDVMKVKIFNNSDEIVILDERLFCISYNDELVFNPIGFNNPYATISTTITSEKGLIGTRNIFESYLDDLYGVNRTSKESRSNTLSIQPREQIVIPSKNFYNYKVVDYLSIVYKDLVKTNKYIENNYSKTNWQKVTEGLEQYNGQSLKFTFAYKLLSEEKWRTASILVNPKNINIKLELKKDEYFK